MRHPVITCLLPCYLCLPLLFSQVLASYTLTLSGWDISSQYPTVVLVILQAEIVIPTYRLTWTGITLFIFVAHIALVFSPASGTGLCATVQKVWSLWIKFNVILVASHKGLLQKWLQEDLSRIIPQWPNRSMDWTELSHLIDYLLITIICWQVSIYWPVSYLLIHWMTDQLTDLISWLRDSSLDS